MMPEWQEKMRAAHQRLENALYALRPEDRGGLCASEGRNILTNLWPHIEREFETARGSGEQAAVPDEPTIETIPEEFRRIAPLCEALHMGLNGSADPLSPEDEQAAVAFLEDKLQRWTPSVRGARAYDEVYRLLIVTTLGELEAHHLRYQHLRPPQDRAKVVCPRCHGTIDGGICACIPGLIEAFALRPGSKAPPGR